LGLYCPWFSVKANGIEARPVITFNGADVDICSPPTTVAFAVGLSAAVSEPDPMIVMVRKAVMRVVAFMISFR